MTQKKERDVLRNYCILLLASIFVFACGRKEEQTSQIVLRFDPHGKVSALSATSKINFVGLNVSGQDMNRIVCTWQEDRDRSTSSGPCGLMMNAQGYFEAQIEFDGSSSDRLIQVLLVSEDELQGGMEFSYGEVKKTLTGGSQNVDLIISSVGTNTSHEGGVHGRYTYGGVNFTGEVALSYTPKGRTAAEAMEIFTLDVFAGWFHIYLFDNIDLTYTIKSSNSSLNGKVLFGGPINFASSPFANTQNILKVTSPERYESYNNDGIYDRKRVQETQIIGMWSDNQPLGKVCYSSSTYNMEYSFIDAAMTSPLIWPSSYTIETSLPTCSGASLTTPVTSDMLALTGEMMRHGGDSLFFDGPFMAFQPSDANYYSGPTTLYINGNSTESTLQLQWRYLPDVSTTMDGVSLFYTTNFDSSTGDDGGGGPEGVDCRDHRDDPSYQEVVIPQGQESYTLSGISSSLWYSTKIYICPRRLSGTYKDGQNPYHKVALRSHCIGGCDTSGGGGGSDPANDPGTPSATLTLSGISGIGADLDITTDNHFTGAVASQPKIIWYASLSGYTLGRYEVEIFDTASPTQNLVCAVETTTMSYIVMSSTCGSNLNTGSDYEIKVTAFDTSDTVITSERLLFTRSLPPDTPAFPSSSSLITCGKWGTAPNEYIKLTIPISTGANTASYSLAASWSGNDGTNTLSGTDGTTASATGQETSIVLSTGIPTTDYWTYTIDFTLNAIDSYGTYSSDLAISYSISLGPSGYCYLSGPL